MDNANRVTGWWIFAGVLLFIAGCLNIIYGIAAIGESKFFTANVTLIVSDLKTWGWIITILGVLQLTAAFSLFAGGGFGRWVGIIASALTAISILATVSLAPIWSLCVFILSLIVLYELAKAPETS